MRMLRGVVVVVLGVAGFLGCEVPPPPVARCELAAVPSVVTFPEACANQSSLATLRVSNNSNVNSCPLLLTLPDGGTFRFAPDASIPQTVGQAQTVEVPLAFRPPRAGDFTGNVDIDDGDPETATASATLTGSASTRAAHPLLVYSFTKPDGMPGRCVDGFENFDDCNLRFPDTVIGRETTRRTLTITNEGCPPATIEAIAIGRKRSQTEITPDPSSGFRVVSPASFPVVVNAGQSITVVVEFTPEDDLSGQDPQQKQTELAVVAPGARGENNTLLPLTIITVEGNGVVPTLNLSPGVCDFSNPLDPCGCARQADGGRVRDTGCFRVDNFGSATARLSAAGCTTTNGRFTVQSCERLFSDGGRQTFDGGLGAGQSVECRVTHRDEPELVSGALVCDFGSTGKVQATLLGGVPPCLDTDPLDQLDFRGQTGTRPIVVHNRRRLSDGGFSCEGCGVLVIDGGYFDPVSPFFQLVDAGFPVRLQACQSRPFNINYSSTFGGTALASWLLESNDRDFFPAKVVSLFGETPVDPPPVAVCTACTNREVLQGDPNCRSGKRGISVSFSESNPKVAWISCANSTDTFPDGGMGRPLDCGISVVGIPGVVSASDLTTRSGAACQRTGTTDAGWFSYDDGTGNVHMCQLKLPPSGNTVTVRVDVRDAVNGRLSPIRDTCTILINP